MADGKIVVANNESGSLEVQAFPPNVTIPVSTTAVPFAHEVGVTSLTTYDGGVLFGIDDTNGNTDVYYAKSGADFNKSSSYSKVATIKGEDLTGVSGNALLTDPGGSLTGGERIRFFNGSSFGTWHKVPEPYQGDDGAFTLLKAGSSAYVYFFNRRHSYDLYGESTTNGSDWSGLSIYDSVIDLNQLVPVINSFGQGICYETSGGPVRAQPLMTPQHVYLTISPSKVKVRTSSKASGGSGVHLKNDKVTLYQLSGKSWRKFATKSEAANGTFSFKIPGYTHTYRAVVADDPGFFQFGYSNEAKLRAVKKH